MSKDKKIPYPSLVSTTCDGTGRVLSPEGVQYVRGIGLKINKEFDEATSSKAKGKKKNPKKS